MGQLQWHQSYVHQAHIPLHRLKHVQHVPLDSLVLTHQKHLSTVIQDTTVHLELPPVRPAQLDMNVPATQITQQHVPLGITVCQQKVLALFVQKGACVHIQHQAQ